MEDLLIALHGAHILTLIGETFSGSESQDLKNCIVAKCQSHLLHFKKTSYEQMKTTFENEV